MKRIEVGIIGTGWCGGIRAEACAKHPGVAALHLVGIIEERPGRGVTFDRIHHLGTRSVVDAAKRATGFTASARCHILYTVTRDATGGADPQAVASTQQGGPWTLHRNRFAW